jgi:hypothetical protein
MFSFFALILYPFSRTLPLHSRILPALGRSRIQYGFTYLLGFQRIFKSRAALFSRLKTFKEISGLMNKRMFIPDTCSWYPPSFHVRLITIRNQNGSPSTHNGIIRMIKKFKAVQIMQVPANRSMFTIDFKR